MKWTDEKVAILTDEYAYVNLEQLAIKLSTTVKGVRRKADKLKLKRATNNQIVDGYKYCSFCQKEHPINDFYKNKSASYGLEYYCKKYYEQKIPNKIKQTTTPKTGESIQKRGESTDKGQKVSHRPLNPIVIKNGLEGKICNLCKQWKPLSEYGNDSKGIGGKRARCKKCYKDMYQK